MEWYEEKCVNRRDWILSHLDQLNLTSQETVMAMLIDYCNTYYFEITLNSLARMANISAEDANEIVGNLCVKSYLEITSNEKGATIWSLKGLFENRMGRNTSPDRSLIDVFESEWRRTLSPKEMEKIKDWLTTMDQNLIILAVREAAARKQYNTTAVDRILHNWQKKGLTWEQVDNGQR